MPQRRFPLSGAKEKVKLKRRNPAGFIISVILFIVFMGALIGGSIFAVNFGARAFEENFGVSVFDVIDCFNDLGNINEDEIVTNPYSEEDEGGFYSSLNAALYLKDGTVTEEYIDGILEAADEVMTSSSASGSEADGGSANASGSDGLANAVISILDAANFDIERLGSYNWQTGEGAGAEMTDRQLAAFMDNYLFGSGRIDEIVNIESFGDVSLGSILSLDQLTISRGSDLSADDKSAYSVSDDGVYLLLTMSLDVSETVDAFISQTSVSGLAGVIKATLPDRIYFSAATDMSDISYGIKCNVNRMAQESCEMRYMTDAMREKYGTSINKFDRLCIIIESLTAKSESGPVDINAIVNEVAPEVLRYLCKSENGEGFSLAELIDLDTVTALESGGDSFVVDAYGMLADFLADALGSDTLTLADIVVVLQSVLCTDYNDGLVLSDRVDLYTDDMAALELAMANCGIASVEDIGTQADINKLTAAGARIVTADPGVAIPDGWVNIYSGLLESEVFDAYEIEGAENYTAEDIAAIIQNGTLTPEQQELLAQIRDKVESGSALEEPPVFNITDKMLGSAIRDMSEQFAYLTDGYGMTVHSVRITESGGRTYADITATVSVASLVEGANNYFGSVLPETMSLGMRIDITPGADEYGPAELISFNGVGESGSVSPIEELTCERLLQAVENIIPGIDLDGILSEMSGSMSEVLSNLGDSFGNYVFVASDAA